MGRSQKGVRRAEADVKDAVGIKQRARLVEPVVSISLRNDVSDRPDAAEVVEGVGERAKVVSCWPKLGAAGRSWSVLDGRCDGC